MTRRKLWVIETRDTEPRERDMFEKLEWTVADSHRTRRQARSNARYVWRILGYETRIRCYVARGDG